LGLALHEAGHDVLAVFSRTMEHARILAERIGSQPTDDICALPNEADLFIVSVKDAVLTDVVQQLVQGREEQFFAHTAGSMPLELFQGMARHYGVFYPMQSFSKERRINFSEVPVFLEASDAQTLTQLKALSATLTPHIYELSTDERRYLHLAAVFACNFANHCYALSAEILQQHGLPFSVMLPLIDETARKVHYLSPLEAQTGPAIRYDLNVINEQQQLLDDPAMKELYERLSKSIYQHAKS
jgi:predicted short-subunit dehydrogenase-like oxidoreductase (DUF2520 family)